MIYSINYLNNFALTLTLSQRERGLDFKSSKGRGNGFCMNKEYSSKHMIDRARHLRKDSTPPEELLWLALRNGQIAGLKFRRQHPIGPYVVDYYCHSAKLVVEVDGMSHIDRLKKDNERIQYFEEQGLKVLRVTNQDVMSDLDAVARGIAKAAGVEWG
jgi:very-short-patch-repair endonuclease